LRPPSPPVVDFDLRSHVNSHGGLVEKVLRNVARQPARQQDFLPIAAGKRRNRAFDERRAQRQFLDDPLHDAPLAAALQDPVARETWQIERRH
jgi:hypothetical protein